MRSTCLGRLGLVLPGEGKVFGRELASHPSCSCRKKFKNAPRQLGYDLIMQKRRVMCKERCTQPLIMEWSLLRSVNHKMICLSEEWWSGAGTL
ncbi:hypothetical protein Plhal304r1_c017g0061361 [Plasmopara halstedii]